MKNNFSAFAVGFVFSLGLGISGMTRPEKVIGFLDIFGKWDPSLLFVMIGAIGVHFFAFKFIRKKDKPLLADVWHVPKNKKITPALIFGSIIFGFGWGLAGYCPGPAIVSLATFQIFPLTFVAAMIAGMFVFYLLDIKFKVDR